MREGTLDELARLVQWTGQGVHGVDWHEIECELGVNLPSSFKEYVERFPAGDFQTWVRVEQPREPTDTHGYVERLRDELRALRVVTHWRSLLGYDIYPDLPGLLPWGRIGGEFVFCWHIKEPDDEAPEVVIVETGEPHATIHRGTMVDCILDILSGRVSGLVDIAEAFSPPEFYPLQLGRPSQSDRRSVDELDFYTDDMLAVPHHRVDKVDELRELVGGVQHPQAVDWSAVERQLIHPLPPDYKRLIEQVGPGMFGDILVAGPVAGGNDAPGLAELTAEALGHEYAGAPVPSPTVPVVWGRAPDGWYCAWALGEFSPERRPVTLFKGSDGISYLPHSMTSYLAWHVRDPKDWRAALWRIGDPD